MREPPTPLFGIRCQENKTSMSTTDNVAGANGPATIKQIQESLGLTAALLEEMTALLKERDERAAEWAKRQEESEKERKAELLRLARETDRRRQETDRRMQETDRRLKKAESLFTSQWGKLMESLVDGDLAPLLNERGIEVEATFQRRRGRRNGEHFEIDIVAVSSHEVVVVEVKTTLRSEDVTEFLAKLPVFTDFCKEYRGRRILGAVAYLVSDASVIAYAERRGLFVIRATGSSASIVNRPGFEPRVFG